MNESYEELRSTLTSLNTMGLFFSPLFALVAAVVFFSTIAIIIEEQKKQVGTIKALGFRNRKIRAKYLLFGVTAAVIGSVLGIILSVLLEGVVLKKIEPRYSFGSIPALMNPLLALGFCAAVIVVVWIVVGLACCAAAPWASSTAASRRRSRSVAESAANRARARCTPP